MTDNQQQTHHKPESRSRSLYSAIWRWHFYAGLLFTPFLILLAVTGGIYLFKPQIESYLYKDYYYVQEDRKAWTASEQIDEVKKAYPEAQIVRYQPPADANRTSEVGIVHGDESLTIFVNPYNGNLTGVLNDDHRFMDKMEEMHGELMAGTVGDRLVELAACWG